MELPLIKPPSEPVKSYFWSCLCLNEDCPLFSKFDPKLHYYAACVVGFYAALILISFADLRFFWSLDVFQDQVEHYIDLVRKKVRRVQMDQKRLMPTQERTEKQLKRSEKCKAVVNALRLGAGGESDSSELRDHATSIVTGSETSYIHLYPEYLN